MAKKYVSSTTLFLSGSGTTVGATSITLESLTDIYNNVLTMTDFGDLGYITLEPDTSTEEQATFTGITANPNGTYTLTGIKTSLAKSPYTQTSGLVGQHDGGTKVVITDTAAFWDTFANKSNDETITGQWTFSTFPVTPATPDASTTVKGISKLSVAPVLATNPIAVGVNDPKLPTADPTTLFAPVVGQTNIQNFETSGTWTKPANAKTVEVVCIGGGGGGSGGGGVGGGGGGGGGGLIRRTFPASLLGSTEIVTVGTGGAGGAGNSGSATIGSDGNNSTFGSWLIAHGGKGGATTGGAGGAGMGLGSNSGVPSSLGGAGGGINGLGYVFGAAGGANVYDSRGGDQVSKAIVISGGASGSGTGSPGSSPSNVPQYEPTPGAGGGAGGNGSTSQSGSTGGAGGKYGGGGGAGGAGGGNGASGGTGGIGGVGFIQIITYI